MIPAALITLRETLEASLVVGIVLAFLHRTSDRKLDAAVWFGVLGGMLLSAAIALLFHVAAVDFQGRTEQIYEGVTMALAAGLLTWMILWMLQQRRSLRRNIEGKVSLHAAANDALGIFLLVFVSTAREGVETVIFLKALILHSQGDMHIFGGILGTLIAVVLSFFLFRGIEILPLKRVFGVSSVLLIFFSAGLVAHGVHEFQEAGFLPILQSTLWDTNVVLHEDGIAGGILKSLFGYNGDPTGLELAAYGLYLAGISVLWRRQNAQT